MPPAHLEWSELSIYLAGLVEVGRIARAPVLGEQGLSMVPFWESVKLTGRPDHLERLGALRAKAVETFQPRLTEFWSQSLSSRCHRGGGRASTDWCR
jgi:hypothetical protein